MPDYTPQNDTVIIDGAFDDFGNPNWNEFLLAILGDLNPLQMLGY